MCHAFILQLSLSYMHVSLFEQALSLYMRKSVKGILTNKEGPAIVTALGYMQRINLKDLESPNGSYQNLSMKEKMEAKMKEAKDKVGKVAKASIGKGEFESKAMSSKAEIMEQAGFTSKVAARGRIKVDALTKTFGSRQIATYFEATGSHQELQQFKRLSVLLESYLNDNSATSYTSQFDEACRCGLITVMIA